MDTINIRVRFKEIIFPALFLISGILIVITAKKYEIGSITNPSAGLFPLMIGFCLIILGLMELRNIIYMSTSEAEVLDKDTVIKIIAVFLILIVWPAFLGLLGYVLVTFIVTLILAKLFSLRGWIKPVTLAFGTTVFIYLCFKKWFYLDLPDGQVIDWFKFLIGG